MHTCTRGAAAFTAPPEPMSCKHPGARSATKAAAMLRSMAEAMEGDPVRREMWKRARPEAQDSSPAVPPRMRWTCVGGVGRGCVVRVVCMLSGQEFSRKALLD
jgi:hypothetical protein